MERQLVKSWAVLEPESGLRFDVFLVFLGHWREADVRELSWPVGRSTGCIRIPNQPTRTWPGFGFNQASVRGHGHIPLCRSRLAHLGHVRGLGLEQIPRHRHRRAEIRRYLRV